METVACNLCGNTEVGWFAVYRDHQDGDSSYRLVKCSDCGLVYLNPRPSLSEVLARSAFYHGLLQEMRRRLTTGRFGRLATSMMRRSRTPAMQPGQCRILDIGCASGEYLAYLRSIGWETTGVEMDPAAAYRARVHLGLNVITGPAETALSDLPANGFDVVTMWHVLEHLDDPRGVLAEVRRVLKPNGRFLIEVPNFESIWAKLFRENWFPIEYPFHRFHFTPQTLRHILASAGFAVQDLRGRPAPAETLWSFHMLHNRLQRQAWDGRLLWSPAAFTALYPLEMLLASFDRTNHMRAIAVPDGKSCDLDSQKPVRNDADGMNDREISL